MLNFELRTSTFNPVPHPIPRSVILTTVLAELGAGVFCLIRYGVSAFSIYLLAAVGLVAMELFAWNAFFVRRRPTIFGQGCPKLLGKLLLVDVLLAVLMELGTLIGAHAASPLFLPMWHPGRMLVFFYAALTISILLAAYAPSTSLPKLVHHSLEQFHQNGRQRILRFFIPVIVYLTVLVLVRLLDSGEGVSWISLATIGAAGVISVGSILVSTIKMERSPERIFALIALTVGLALIVPFPATNLFSWDDEVHYRNANALSYVANVEQTASDRMMTTLFAVEDGFAHDATFGRLYGDIDQWSFDDIRSFSEELDASHSAETTQVTGGLSYILMQFSFIGYIPSAISLWLGRLLHLPFTVNFAMGRLANLISYIVVTYCAIRTIPCKKVLLAVIALLPTNIFLAANYSYDAWLTSWTLLAVAATIREIEAPGPITLSTWSGLLIIFLFALGPKAVYFPLIALMILIPEDRFTSKKQKRGFYLLAIMVASLIVSTFALGFLASGGGEGDARGGDNVSGAGQLAYALANPVGFFSTLFSFTFGNYLTFENFAFAFTAFAYLGYPWDLYTISAGLLVMFVLAVSVAEGSVPKSPLHGIGKKLWTLFLCVTIVLLSSAALYFSFTEVGSETIAGVQPRYMLPLVFPVCALVLNFPHRWRINNRILSAISLSVSATYLLAYTWLLFSSRIIA